MNGNGDASVSLQLPTGYTVQMKTIHVKATILNGGTGCMTCDPLVSISNLSSVGNPCMHTQLITTIAVYV